MLCCLLLLFVFTIIIHFFVVYCGPKYWITSLRFINWYKCLIFYVRHSISIFEYFSCFDGVYQRRVSIFFYFKYRCFLVIGKFLFFFREVNAEGSVCFVVGLRKSNNMTRSPHFWTSSCKYLSLLILSQLMSISSQNLHIHIFLKPRFYINDIIIFLSIILI